MTTADLLRSRLEASGLTVRRFARDVLRREERTIYRWLAGSYMPRVVREFLEDPKPAPWP